LRADKRLPGIDNPLDRGWSVRITSFAELYPTLFPAPARRLAYLSSEFLALLVL
jgi:hypothetical protein